MGIDQFGVHGEVLLWTRNGMPLLIFNKRAHETDDF